jgi:hypothetical protein
MTTESQSTDGLQSELDRLAADLRRHRETLVRHQGLHSSETTAELVTKIEELRRRSEQVQSASPAHAPTERK